MIIETKNLVKIYGDRSVVNDVSFEVNKGEVVCLLGPNGAGKTTTFYMIVGLEAIPMVKVLVNGACGRMGQAVVKAVIEDKDFFSKQ